MTGQHSHYAPTISAKISKFKPALAGVSRLQFGFGGRGAPFVGAIFINAVVFGIFLVYATPMYETNDDLMLQSIASGFYTGHPDEHLIFTNIIVGRMLAILYTSWPAVNWYITYLIATHFLAMTVIAYLLFRRGKGYRPVLLYLVFFLIVEMRILLHLQFTTTAFLVGAAGVLLLVDGLLPGDPIVWWKLLGGMLLLTVMCLIREQVALLLGLVAASFFIERLRLSGWKRMLGVTIGCLGLFAVLHGIDRWAYQQDPAWAEYSQYNDMRGEMHVTPLTRYIPKASPAVGWSANDGLMFSEFYFPDANIYAGSGRMRRLLEELKVQRDNDVSPPHLPFAESVRGLFPGDSGILMNLSFLTAILCVTCAGPSRRHVAVVLLATFAVIFAFSFYLFSTARLPERVAYNFPLFTCLICMYWVAGIWKSPVASRESALQLNCDSGKVSLVRCRRFLLPALVTALGISYLYNVSMLAQSLWSADSRNRNLKCLSQDIFAPIEPVLPKGEVPLLIPMPVDSVVEQSLFFYPLATSVPFHILPYGFITHSPVFEHAIARYHLESYSLALVTRADVFFLMEARWIPLLQEFYREHYQLDIHFDSVVNTDNSPRYAAYHIYLYRAHIGDTTQAGHS